MKLNRSTLNESGIAHLLLLVVVVVVAIGGVGTLVAVRQSKARNDSKTVAQAPESQQSTKTDQSTQKTEASPVTQATDSSTPAATPAPTTSQTQPAPKPAAPKITHPTDASCPGEGKTITVYASVSGGTPVYKQNYASPELLAKKLDYGTSVAVSCYNGWVTYRVGEQPYYMNYADVSVTKP